MKLTSPAVMVLAALALVGLSFFIDVAIVWVILSV